MKILIELETDNACFEEDFQFSLEHVLGQVHDKVAQQRRRSARTICTSPESADKLLDINGNTVGSVLVKK